MRIVYQSGKLYLSLTKDEYKDIEPGKPTELDISLIPVLFQDISQVTYERLKEQECTKE
tara:strand:- start:876 stop:1052 length:177 start_codon:yes stop_codon:yes gene_type:complete